MKPTLPSSPASSPGKSLVPLAVVAMREAGADGFALFRKEADDRLLRVDGCGVGITEETLDGAPGLAVASYVLRSFEQHPTGLLAFAFKGRTITSAATSRLCRMAAAIEQVWRLSEAAGRLTGLAARVGELEAELADSKIASRTRGFLQNPTEASDLVETVTRHVQTVLKGFESSSLLEKRRQELEQELEERSLTGKAKALLQATSGLSEEAAHLHLRLLSRKTRRPIREVAIEVIAQSQTNASPSLLPPAQTK